MSLHSVIRTTISSFFIVWSINLTAQIEGNSTQQSSEEKFKETIDAKQRNVAYSLGYHEPIASGDNFIGQGLEGNGGFDFKVQIFVYKQFFVGGSLGASYFDVKDPTITGNYKKSRIAEEYVFLGYEFVLDPDLRIGINASLFGQSDYKNSSGGDVFQKDSANFHSYGFYVTYEISREFMLYVDYAYRVDKTEIQVPAVLEDTFRKGTFHQIGIGLKFSFIGDDLISSLF